MSKICYLLYIFHTIIPIFEFNYINRKFPREYIPSTFHMIYLIYRYLNKTYFKKVNTLKITILGQWGAYPEKNSATAGYLIQSDNTNILLDCGCGVLSKLQNHINIEDLHGVVISHYHADHFCDVQSLQYASKILKVFNKLTHPLKIYGLKVNPYFEKLNYADSCVGYEITSKSQISIGDFSLCFCNTNHTMPCLSIKVCHGNKSVIFSGDTAFTNDLIYLSKNADLLMCESSLFNEDKGRVPGHLTAGETGLIAKKAEVKKLLLTHLPHYGNITTLLDQAKQEFSGEVILAEGGMIIEL